MINLKTEKWQINNIEAIIFDKDGTLVDLHYFWGKMTELRVKEIIKRSSLDETNFENLCLFLGFDVKRQKMISQGITALYSRSIIIEMLKNELLGLNVEMKNEEIENVFNEVSEKFYKQIEKYIKPIPEAFEFVKKAKKFGLKLGIVTADSLVSTNLTLKILNWEKYFDVVIARESHPDTKESGNPTKLALSKMNANPELTIMIGDTPMDALSAENANLKASILISTGQMDMNELQKHSIYCENSLYNVKLSKMLEMQVFGVSKK